jgi:hypothetical protein
VDWSLSRGYVTGPITLASWPTLTILWHLAVFQLMGARPRLIIRLGHPLDLSEKSPRLEARTPRESRNHRLLTANPRVERNSPDPARVDAKARAARAAAEEAPQDPADGREREAARSVTMSSCRRPRTARTIPPQTSRLMNRAKQKSQRSAKDEP